MMKRVAYIFITSIIIGTILLNFSSCANTTAAPTGGDKDTIPPVLLKVEPAQRKINFPITDNKVTLTFNEYTVVKNANDILLSPPQKKRIKTKVKGKSIVVTFQDTLIPDRTYTLNFGSALADNNEGNPFGKFVYTFSTGEIIDSMYFTGTVMDAKTLLPKKGVLVSVYTDFSDSALFKSLPYAATKSDDWGYFALTNIKPQKYRIYAVEDLNNNNIYDPATEQVGFIGDYFQPTLVVNDTVPELALYDMKDTIGCRSRRSDFNILMFKESGATHKVKSVGRPSLRECYVKFQSSNAEVESITFSGIPEKDLIKQFNPTKDSLSIWINDKGYLPDTLFAHIKYMKSDSTNKLVLSDEDLKFAMEKKPFVANQKKEAWDTSVVMTIISTPENIDQDGYKFDFGFPIVENNYDKLTYQSISPRGDTINEEYKIVPDLQDIKKFALKPKNKMQEGYTYHLTVRKGCFIDINGLPNDSTYISTKLPSEDGLSTITLLCKGVYKRYIVDLVSENREKVFRSYTIDEDILLEFPYLKEGKYSIRITEDGNKNGIIDIGSLLDHRQPEKVLLYETPSGETIIEVKPNIEINQTIDLLEMFR